MFLVKQEKVTIFLVGIEKDNPFQSFIIENSIKEYFTCFNGDAK